MVLHFKLFRKWKVLLLTKPILCSFSNINQDESYQAEEPSFLINSDGFEVLLKTWELISRTLTR